MDLYRDVGIKYLNTDTGNTESFFIAMMCSKLSLYAGELKVKSSTDAEYSDELVAAMRYMDDSTPLCHLGM